MSFRTGPCCNCCGDAWQKPAVSANYKLYNKNPLYRPSVNPQEEAFYGSLSDAFPTNWGDIDPPYGMHIVGATSKGDVLGRPGPPPVLDVWTPKDIYRLRPFPPFEIVGIEWDASTFIAAGTPPSESMFIYYHDEWGYGITPSAGGVASLSHGEIASVFDSDGARVRGADDITGSLSTASRFCTDPNGNLYWIGFPPENEDHSFVGMNANTNIGDFEWVAEEVFHTGISAYVASEDEAATRGLYKIDGGPTLAVELPFDRIRFGRYSEVLKRAYVWDNDDGTVALTPTRLPYVPSLDTFPQEQVLELYPTGTWGLIEWQ